MDKGPHLGTMALENQGTATKSNQGISGTTIFQSNHTNVIDSKFHGPHHFKVNAQRN